MTTDMIIIGSNNVKGKTLEKGSNMKNGCCLDHSCTPASCMALPAAFTCSDCVYAVKCLALFGVKGRSTSCDFFPRRFVARGYPIDTDNNDALNGRR